MSEEKRNRMNYQEIRANKLVREIDSLISQIELCLLAKNMLAKSQHRQQIRKNLQELKEMAKSQRRIIY